MSKNKAFYNISLSKLSSNREVFPWNLFIYSWQGKKTYKLPYLYLYLPIYLQIVEIQKEMTQRQMVNHLKVLLHAKELSGNLHFDIFFHFERHLSAGRWPRNNTSQWATSSCVYSRLHFSPPNHCGEQLCDEGSRCSPELQDPTLRHTAQEVYNWVQPVFR